MPEPRKWYGGMKPVGRPQHEEEPRVAPVKQPEKSKVKHTKEKPLQKGLPPGEESVE